MGWGRFRKIPLFQRRRLPPAVPRPRMWLRTVKGSSIPSIKHAHRPKVRRICGPITPPYQLRKQRGYAREDSEASPRAQLREMDEVDSARRLSSRRSRAQQNAVDSRELAKTGRQHDTRRRQADAYLNSATKEEILKQHAQCRLAEMQLLRNTSPYAIGWSY